MQIHQEIPVVPEGNTRKSFCQYVCMLFLSWNVLGRNRLRPYQLPNEVESHVDVLSSCRAKRIVSYNRAIAPSLSTNTSMQFSDKDGTMKDNTDLRTTLL